MEIDSTIVQNVQNSQAEDTMINNTTENALIIPSITNLDELLNVSKEFYLNNNGTFSPANSLLAVLRKNHFWPALQVKRFKNKPNLILLHNTYKRTDVSKFQALYDECRSVVLDLAAEDGKSIIVTFANSIPERMTDTQYEKIIETSDSTQISYEGTVVTVYYHDNTWHFGTSSCPNIDISRYFHPTKTHGNMLDEALSKFYPDIDVTQSVTLRDKFTSSLDVSKAYAFILVHHNNSHTVDYSSVLGENYAVLVHIATRDRVNLSADDISSKPLSSVGLFYPITFEDNTMALSHIRENKSVYGLLVNTSSGKTYKVCREEIVKQEECDLGNPNKWHNIMWLYMQNRTDYHIVDYQRDFAPNLDIPRDLYGKQLVPTYIVHTVICTLRDILYTLYRSTTIYNLKSKRFRMNKELDATYDPLVRFHLAQLRHIQVDELIDNFLTKKEVYQYICQRQTLKNIRLLIRYFAGVAATSNNEFMTPRAATCIVVLNHLLSQRVVDKTQINTTSVDTEDVEM